MQDKTGLPKPDIKPLTTRSIKRTYHKPRFVLKNWKVFNE